MRTLFLCPFVTHSWKNIFRVRRKAAVISMYNMVWTKNLNCSNVDHLIDIETLFTQYWHCVRNVLVVKNFILLWSPFFFSPSFYLRCNYSLHSVLFCRSCIWFKTIYKIVVLHHRSAIYCNLSVTNSWLKSHQLRTVASRNIPLQFINVSYWLLF